MISLHVWFKLITTPLCFLRFSIILVFAFDPSPSSHPLPFSYISLFIPSLTLHVYRSYTSRVAFLHIPLSDHFSSSPYYWHHVHVGHIQVHGSRASLYILHFIHKGMSFDHWVFGSSFPSFLSPYHPSLRYVPCLKTTLRPWDQVSSSTAFAWTGVWDLVAF